MVPGRCGVIPNLFRRTSSGWYLAAGRGAMRLRQHRAERGEELQGVREYVVKYLIAKIESIPGSEC